VDLTEFGFVARLDHIRCLSLLSNVRGVPDHWRVAATWTDLIDQVQSCLERTGSHQFVLVEYDGQLLGGPDPYAQAARIEGSWHCEVVSARYLMPGRWPLNEVWLKGSGWSLSALAGANWFQSADTELSAATALVDGLRLGRQCAEPTRFCVSVHSFSGGPGPDDGESVFEEAPRPSWESVAA